MSRFGSYLVITPIAAYDSEFSRIPFGQAFSVRFPSKSGFCGVGRSLSRGFHL